MDPKKHWKYYTDKLNKFRKSLFEKGLLKTRTTQKGGTSLCYFTRN